MEKFGALIRAKYYFEVLTFIQIQLYTEATWICISKFKYSRRYAAIIFVFYNRSGIFANTHVFFC